MMRTLVLLLALSTTALVHAAEPVVWPKAAYDETVPAINQVLGHAAGERISSHAQIVRYFEALAQARPDEVRLVDYAQSWEGRRLFYVIIARPELMGRLDAIQSNIQRLAAGDGLSDQQASELTARLPGTVWLSYAVHGNEISSSDAAMMTAYHLLAAGEDETVRTIRDNTIVFIDPLQNPDGRDRFVHSFEMALGLEPFAHRLAAEHQEPWPSGRVNHYLFDLNRDWLAVTQPETQGRIEALLQWYPLAFVDAHEMGADETYFFAPEAVPFNPHLAAAQRENLQLFGQNNARWFDRFGIDYFTREVFDAFYPGYGASWPSYYGGVAMTYEQASSRGLVMRRRDGREFTYAETVRNHFVTSIATAETVARHRQALWEDFGDYRRSAIEEGSKGDLRAYVIPAQTDQAAADKLAGLLALQGVSVMRADAELRACGDRFGAGSYVVPLAQPSKRLIRTVLDPQVEMDAPFLEEQERRRAKDLPDEIYDVTAWALPLMFNVDIRACSRSVDTGGLAQVGPERVRPGAMPDDSAEVAFVIPGGSRATGKALARALRQGLVVQSSEEAFVSGERRFPHGSLIFKVDDNGPELAEQLSVVARETGAEVAALDQSWVSEGPNFGSDKVVDLIAPRVALAWDQPTSPYAPGAVRFVLERQFGYPVMPIRTRTLREGDLRSIDTLILPDEGWGSYEDVLGESGAENIRRWVQAGGVLVTLAGGTRWAAMPGNELLAMRSEHQFVEASEDEAASPAKGADDEDPPEAGVPGTRLDEASYENALRPEQESPDAVAGVLVRAEVDQDHWLGQGVAPTLNVLVRGSDIFTPLRRDEGVNVARFAAADALLVSGYLWEENRQQLAFKPFVSVQPLGQGMIVAFTQDPAVRAYLDGLNMILVNAVLRAPSYTTRLR